jgi:hypothetical protein
MPLAELTATLVLSAVPWRAVRLHRGQQHLPGLYWSATTGGHVIYESRLELARLLLADFDPDVVGIAAQPLLVRDGDRRHVPDFLRADRSVLIVNVKLPSGWVQRRLRMRCRGRGVSPRATDLTPWPQYRRNGARLVPTAAPARGGRDRPSQVFTPRLTQTGVSSR